MTGCQSIGTEVAGKRKVLVKQEIEGSSSRLRLAANGKIEDFGPVDLAATVTTHAVGDHRDARSDAVAVLVDLALRANVCRRTHAESDRHENSSKVVPNWMRSPGSSSVAVVS